MISGKRLRAAFYTYGSRGGVRVAVLYGCVEVVRVAGHFRDWWRRRRAAKRLVRSSRFRGFVDRRRGYATLSQQDFPAIGPMVEACRRYYEMRRDSIEISESEPFVEVVEANDFRRLPELLDFALSEPAVEVAADYFGTVPRLHNLGLWFTPARDRMADSQLFHLDKPDINFLQLFVNVFDTSEKNGPLVLLPADLTKRYRTEAGYDRSYLLGDGRAVDRDVYAITGNDGAVSLSGPAGSGGIVDTSRCLHYGSRTTEGFRLVAVIQYVPSHRIAPNFANRFAAGVTRTDPIARMLVPEELR